MTEAKVVELVKEWKDEIKQVISDYNSMLQKLDTAVTVVEASKNKWWVTYKTPLTVVGTSIGLAFAALILIFGMKYTDTCIVNINQNGQGYAVQSCKQSNQPKQ